MMNRDSSKRFPRPASVDGVQQKTQEAGDATPKIAAGVPLGKLIPRELVMTPEVIMVNAPRSPGAERFRRLKTLLLHDPQDEPQVIVVTSALPAEGKSLVALNLALAFAADRDGDVLLVDADIRRPGIDRWLQPAPKIGLKEVLTGEAELDHGLLEIAAHHLTLLPAGEPPRDPVPLLAGAGARTLIATLRKRFKRIIIDTPPIVPFTDADVIGAMSDGVVLIARSRATPRPLLEQAIASITSTRVLGIVLNDATSNLADRRKYHDGYYSSYYGRREDS